MPPRTSAPPSTSSTAVERFERLLRSLTGIDGELTVEAREQVQKLSESLGPITDDLAAAGSMIFYGRMNQKLNINRDAFAALYTALARLGITLNYPSKKRIEWGLNCGEYRELEEEIAKRGLLPDEITKITHSLLLAKPSDTRGRLVAEATSPSKLRRQPQRLVASDVFNSAAGPLAHSIWPEREVMKLTAPSGLACDDKYMINLRNFQPEIFKRQRSLVTRFIHPVESSEYLSQRDGLTSWIAQEYEKMDNYGHLALVIDTTNHSSSAWRLASDLALFAERFSEERLKQMFFQSKRVANETTAENPNIDERGADFEILNEGFTYKDTFVLHNPDGIVTRLVVTLQKNRRDETPVPCPSCRTSDIGGNSYPTFGVKSWECRNLLCPDRSIYNRGKRYDFRSLLKQEAIEVEGNEIPVESVRRWQRDVLPFISDQEIAETLIRHHSMRGDVVFLLNWTDSTPNALGRNVNVVQTGPEISTRVYADDFWNSAFFQRFLPTSATNVPSQHNINASHARAAIAEGDAYQVLRRYPKESFDRAVTSPPYYNAREYAQWSNLYTYLYDMYRISEEVYRTLKPGALYAYNIFDYFDNENIVTKSDMGKKRILLSALMVDIFRRIGFEYLGSTVWDKGEIQGKRGFNAGNFAPFYQKPFNCWEHVLIVRKPASSGEPHLGIPDSLNRVLKIHPVVKMIKGVNTLGHTAPYPIQLVEKMLASLPSGSLVLDPFGGSGTTALGALSLGLRALLIERDPVYAELSRSRVREHLKEGSANK
ncbi:DNA-methyltransferase [Microbacterium galbinum]|uniref:DNA-methyltransferase n=1 Tax=Microbacterium galbinum TaxID=2851646 RepID=UPI001FFCE0BF|nr:site-specific DNA-methyltransferase [Microbacterium galbinum]MCK2029891.1 site-specific DNA-methyltransferase [Microbacterium galbinum]